MGTVFVNLSIGSYKATVPDIGRERTINVR